MTDGMRGDGWLGLGLGARDEWYRCAKSQLQATIRVAIKILRVLHSRINYNPRRDSQE